MVQYLSYTCISLSLLFLFAFRCSLASAVDINIGVLDWETVDGVGTLWDGKFSQGISAAFIIAAHHFNERRVDILPDLELVKSCNKNISIVQYCETSGNMRRSSTNTMYMLENFNIHGIGKLLFLFPISYHFICITLICGFMRNNILILEELGFIKLL